MELSVHERLGALEILPREGKYAALKALRVAREVLSLTPDEMKAFDYVETPSGHGGGVTIKWDNTKERVKDIPLDKFATDTIVNLLVQLEKEGKLSDQTFSLYEKFVAQ